jgi:hypothetical protein
VPWEAVLQSGTHLIEKDPVLRVVRVEHFHDATRPQSGAECERPIEVPQGESIGHV